MVFGQSTTLHKRRAARSTALTPSMPCPQNLNLSTGPCVGPAASGSPAAPNEMTKSQIK